MHYGSTRTWTYGGIIISDGTAAVSNSGLSTYDVPAEWDGLKGKKVAVVCKPLTASEFSAPRVDRALAKAIGEDLKARVKDIEIVEPRKVADLIDAKGLADYVEIGKELKADKVQRIKVRVICEPIEDSVDPPRVMPLVGPVQLHHVHFKCTVSFAEAVRSGWPFLYTTLDEDCQQVIYIDHDHLHRVGDSKTAAADAKEVR